MPHLRSLVIATSLALASFTGFADTTPSMQQAPSQATIDYLNINMPGGQPSMGLVGLHYDVNLLPIKDFYTGLGAYGAVSGNQGGFFTLGIDNSYRPHLYGPLYLNTGFYVGGGGARSAQTGGGLMLMPYGGLGLEIGRILLTLNYSYVSFPTGKIGSSQLLFGFTIPLDFNYFQASAANYKGMDFSAFHLPKDTQGTLHSWYFSPMAQIYHVRSGTTNLYNQAVDNNLGLIGFEMGKYFNQHFYGALRTLGLAHGNANGYMNVMIGPGFQLPIGFTPFTWVNDAMIGAGGGGNLQTKGGFLAEADTGVAWNLTSAFSPRIMAGYLVAPNGNFHTWVYTLGLNYNFGILSPSGHGSDLSDTQFSLKNWRVSINNQTLFNPQRTSSDTGSINSIDVHLDQFLRPSLYLSYRAAFAYQGQHSGGMAEGLIGVGWQHAFFDMQRLMPHIAVLGGAIGGGNINAGGGLIVEPELGLTFSVTPTLGLDISGGRMISVQQNLNSDVLTAGVSFNFGEAQRF
jgi:hypothetical protein